MEVSDKLSHKERKTKEWIDLVNESVHTSDDADIGDIIGVSRDLIVVKRGLLNVHYYYVPIGKVEGWDGDVVWLKVPEEFVKKNYERDTNPDPSRYYIKDTPGYNSIFPKVDTILPRFKKPAYTTENTSPKDLRGYPCDLCKSAFESEDELTGHISTTH
jgi:hypothetical protein